MSADSTEKIQVLDLNIKELAQATGKHLIDIVLDYEGEIDESAVCALIKDNSYSSLPEPFNEKQPTNLLYHMQVNMHKKQNDKWQIVKWFMFEEKQVFVNIQDKLIHGQAFQPTWTSPAFISHVMKVLQWRFERLPLQRIVLTTLSFITFKFVKAKYKEYLDKD